MKLREKTNFLPEILFFLGVFFGMTLFYTAAHPLVLIDLDDWAYFSYARLALPFPNFWNPSRVLPELLMPACGTAAALLSAALLHDYVRAQVLVVAWVYSAFITFYVWAFARLLRRRLGAGRGVSLLLALIFLLLHFLIFRSGDSGNIHLFYTVDVVCIFFYTIPALLNAALAMLLLGGDLFAAFVPSGRPLRRGFVLLLLYLALFSNLFGSVILAVCAGCGLLGGLFGGLREKRPFGALLREQLPRLLLIAGWLLAVLFEALGGRARASYGSGMSLGGRIGETLRGLAELLRSMNLLFAALLAAGMLFALLMLLLPGRAARRPLPGLLGLSLAAAALCAVFLVLLCAVVDPLYIRQPSASFALFFWLLLPLGVCAGWALTRWTRLSLLLPLALLVIASAIGTNTRTFADQNCLGVTGQACIDINNDLIAQLQRADAEGLDAAEILTLDSPFDYDNWPHSTFYLGDTLARTLWKHGVVERLLSVTLVPSEAFNAAHGLHF